MHQKACQLDAVQPAPADASMADAGIAKRKREGSQERTAKRQLLAEKFSEISQAAADGDEPDGTTIVAPQSIKLYAWVIDDCTTFEDVQSFMAALPEDLIKLQTWKPKDEDDYEGLPSVIGLNFPHHTTLEKDVQDKSSGTAKLFKAQIENEFAFCLYFDCEPDFALMEVTLAKTKPTAGEFVNVHVGTATHTEVDGFMSDFDEDHDLQKQGYCWVTAVRAEHDPTILRMAQKFVKAHLWGVCTLLESAEETESVTREDTASEVGHGQTKPETVKLYLWTYDAEEFEDNRYLPAVDANELKAFENWQPNNRDDDSGLPGLIAAELPYHKSLQRDVKDRSRDIGKLFDVFVNAGNGSGISFCMFYEGDPEHVLLEATLSLTKPITGPFVEVTLITAMHDQVDNFYPWPGKPHPLYQQGYRYIVSTRVEDDPKILRLSQRLDRNHALGLEVDGDDPDEDL